MAKGKNDRRNGNNAGYNGYARNQTKEQAREQAIGTYEGVANRSFSNLGPYNDNIKRLWRQIILHKMYFFSLGMPFNMTGQHFAPLYYTMGFLGGMSWGYWTSIALLQYYLDPRWLSYSSSPDFEDGDVCNTNTLHRRLDTRASSVSHGSVTGMMGVLLPNGLNSFRVSFKKLRNRLGEDVNKNTALKEALSLLERLATEKLQQLLSDPKKNIYSKLSALTSDYLNYGTCVALLEKVGDKVRTDYQFTHIPFAQAALANTASDPHQKGLWVEPKPLFSLAMEEGYHCVDAGTGMAFKNHMYITGDLIGKNPKEFYELSSTTAYYTAYDNFTPEEPRRICGYRDTSPLLVARVSDQGQIYGMGCGIKSMGSIIYLNLFSNCSKLAAMSSYYPASIVSANSTLESNNITHGNSISTNNTSPLVLLPGRMYKVTLNEGVAAPQGPAVEKLSNAPEQMAVFEQASINCLNEIQSAYFMTFLANIEGDKREVTATEVRERSTLAVQQFKGLLEIWYNNILYQVVNAFAEIACDSLYRDYGDTINLISEASGGRFFPEKDFAVELMNFEKKQYQQERVGNLATYAEILRNLGLQPTQEEMEKMQNEFRDILGWGL